MKKLVVGSFAFVLTLMLAINVFATTYDVTEYDGENGLERSVATGDVLNLKNDIVREKYGSAVEVLGTYWDEQNNITINGNGYTMNGGGYEGFKMTNYDSSLSDDTSRTGTIKNATLTNYSSSWNAMIQVVGDSNGLVTLNLEDVNLINNAVGVQNDRYTELNIISNGTVEISSSAYIRSYGTLNFKGKNINISSTTLNFYGEVNNSSNLTVDSSISGDGYIYNYKTMNIGGDASGFGGLVYVENGTINLLEGASYFSDAENVYINGTLNLVNNSIDDGVDLNTLGVAGTMKLNIDVDLAEQAIDDVQFGRIKPINPRRLEPSDNDIIDGRATAINPDQQEPEAKISLNKINLLSDANSKYTTYTFGEGVQDFIELSSSQKEILGPIFAYKVSYGEEEKGSSDEGGDDDNLPFNPLQPGDEGGDDEGGDDNLPFNPLNPAQDPTGADAGSDEQEKTALLQFERLGGGDGEVDLTTGGKIEGQLNPILLQSKVAIAASSISQEEVFDTVLNNAGNYTYFQKQGTAAGDVEDRAAPTLWIKAFGSQEDVDMEDYTKVKTTYYGAVVGLDWDRQYSDNFDATYGIFASYIGGELKDEDWSEGDFKVKQNGGYAGLRGNWYIGKLFINGILDYGMLQNDADNPYKSNDFNSQVIGAAARVGYNFEVARRRFTIQPSVGATGKYIITDDFETALKNGKDIKEEMDDVTNITVEPGLKLALNLGKCWILSGEGKYVIENFSGDTKVKGEDLDFILPDTSYKNYTNVGLGIEKIWGYTVLHVKGNKTFGGRDGFIVNAGIEFKF